MTIVIDTLTQMASDASLQSEQAIKQLLIATEVNTEQAEAIINKDVSSLDRQLDVRLDIFCGIFPAEDDDESEEKDDDKDDTDSSEETSNQVIGF